MSKKKYSPTAAEIAQWKKAHGEDNILAFTYIVSDLDLLRKQRQKLINDAYRDLVALDEKASNYPAEAFNELKEKAKAELKKLEDSKLEELNEGDEIVAVYRKPRIEDMVLSEKVGAGEYSKQNLSLETACRLGADERVNKMDDVRFSMANKLAAQFKVKDVEVKKL